MVNVKGIVASPGIAIGKALIFRKDVQVINCDCIDSSRVEDEIALYKDAVARSEEQLHTLAANTRKRLGADKAAIFEAHLDILNDPVLEESVLEKIRNRNISAEYALDLSVKEICEMFESLDDPYLKERAADVKDVCSRLMCNIKGTELVSLANMEEKCIVVAKDLTPSDTASMDLDKILGFATDMGGPASHTAILAKSLGIPALVGLKDLSYNVKNGDILIIDALQGEVHINPSEKYIRYYELKKKEYQEYKMRLAELKDFPACTVDGRRVELCANISGVNDLKSVEENGAEGVGLFRTEFLYMDSMHFPTEEEQFRVYREVAEKLNGKPVTIRTLDVGGDKDLPYFSFNKEQNPFLGWRAIRICLDRVDIFKTQLRAILRAGAFGRVRVMFPMIISLDELRRAKEILEECKNELKAEGKSFEQNIEIGIMVETPAVVILAEKFAREVDFFSIGTNDLTQYTLAVDRGNEKTAGLYNPLHPAVLNSIKRIIDASHKAQKQACMCGELAGNIKAAPLLIGMGLDEFSMSAASIPEIKKLIRSLSYEEMRTYASKALEMDTSSEVETFVETILNSSSDSLK